MSAITWQENRLIQHVGTHDEELGYVDFDENSGTYVLWLKDTCGVLGSERRIHTGDEFPSMTVCQTEGRVIAVRVHSSLHMDEERCQTGNHTSLG